MKVAVISCYCLDSTMPLVKNQADSGVDVHLFCVMPRGGQNSFVVDFTNNKQPNGFVDNEILKKQMGEGLCQYLSRVKTKFFVFPGGGMRSLYFLDYYYAWKLSNIIKKGKFDVVHLIHVCGHFSIMLMHFLKDQKLIQTLHEVTDHGGQTTDDNLKILKELVKRDIPIIFHSQVSRERYITFRSTVTKNNLNEDLYTIIRFSLYETYFHFNANKKKITHGNINGSIPTVLHFGRIVPYKGIEVLIDAIRIVQEKQPVHLVVAGGGDPYFNFDGIDSYEFINYSITNEEIIELIKNCTIVVCPYRSASQSGIPMTVYPFNKPIIASKIGGFKEIIEHNDTGLLVDELDGKSFAEAIGCLISNKELQEKMKINIAKKFSEGEFAWSNIVEQTIRFYEKYS